MSSEDGEETLLQKMQRYAAKHPHDRQLVLEVSSEENEFKTDAHSLSPLSATSGKETKLQQHRKGSKQHHNKKNDNDRKLLQTKFVQLQQDYEEKLSASQKKIESQAALALMASENSMREEYRLEISRYRERERAAREEMEKLRRSVQLLLATRSGTARSGSSSSDTY